jgi:DeoR/GlpR family transcriptional regulator of sugar metabolism
MNKAAEANQPDDLLPAERRQRLLEWFETRVAGSNQELARLLNTSVSTIRRDLDLLATQGLVRRTHGGAVRIRGRSTFEPSLEEAGRSAAEGKRAIAAEAVKRLKPEQSLLLDTGTTLHELGYAIAQADLPLTVVTNDVLIARTLAELRHVKLIVPGGSLREGSFTLLGEPGVSFLRDIHCDVFFLCAQAVSEDSAADISTEAVQLKRAMLDAAARSILLVDSSKFGTHAFYRIAPLSRFDEIITDGGINPDERARLEARGAPLTCVALNGPEESAASTEVARREVGCRQGTGSGG